MSATIARLAERDVERTPSIGVVYWNRLEPRPRSPEIADALAARVRDPLWMLTRQWQWGEFAGEDAGSPAYVQIGARTGGVRGWRVAGGAWQDVGASLEESVESEGLTADLATRIELGQLFERLLAGAVDPLRLSGIVAAYRGAFAPATADIPATDVGGRRLAALAAGRAIDGVAVAAPNAQLPNAPDVVAESQNVQAAVDALRAAIGESLGSVGASDAPAWRRDELAYRVEVEVEHPTDGPLLLRARPDRDATFDWFAFDAVADSVVRPRAGAPAPLTTVSCVPAFVSFRGMPNHRWWDFERGATDFGAITPDRRDVAKLLLMDFMLIHGNDYFVVPFEQQVGTVCCIERVLVHDVFGTVTLVERADRNAGPAGRRWTCFSTATSDRGDAPGDFLFLPPTSGVQRLEGDSLEDVRFVRDEQANYVWAIEQSAEGRDGVPRIGRERHDAEVAGEPAPQTAAQPPATGPSPIAYRLQTFVPWHWFPMVPVLVNAATGEIALEQGRMTRPGGAIPEPLGRILAGAGPYRVREETVSRVGVRVVREAVRARDLLGGTHLWTARRNFVGRGEGSSGLRYDIAIPRDE